MLLQIQAGPVGPQGRGAKGRELRATGSADSWHRAVHACVLKTVTFLYCRHHLVSCHPWSWYSGNTGSYCSFGEPLHFLNLW